MKHAWLGGLVMLGVGCGQSSHGQTADTTATETTAVESATAASGSATPAESEDTPAEPTAPPFIAEADARAQAEAFVRAQGYANTPPTVPEDEIVHEFIEGTVAMRQNSLDPTPVSASASPDGSWGVVFRYINPDYAGRGRMLVLRPGQPPRFVHQDLILRR